jgi:hypothetical protein
MVSMTLDHQEAEYASIQDAVKAFLAEYPEGVIYDAGGFERTSADADADYDVRNDRVAMLWAAKADAVNDDGLHAVGTIDISN